MSTDYLTSSLKHWIKKKINTKKKHVLIYTCPPNTEHKLISGWSGGSRDYFSAFDINTGAEVTVEITGSHWCGDEQLETGWIQPDQSVLVVGGVFCGKPAYIKMTLATNNPVEDIKKFFV